MDDELRNRKARMNRVLTPLCGFIAAVALIGLVLVVLSGLGVFREEYSETAQQSRPAYAEPTFDPVSPSFGPNNTTAEVPVIQLQLRVDISPSSIQPYRVRISGGVQAPRTKGISGLNMTAIIVNTVTDEAIGTIVLAENAALPADASLDIYEIKYECPVADIKLVVYAEWLANGAAEAERAYYTVYRS